MNFRRIEAIAARLSCGAVIGGYALAAHGYVRQTADFDILTTDRDVLREAFWADERAAGVRIETYRGDFDDPLDGAARLRGDSYRLDVIVAKFDWQAGVIARAQRMDFGVAEFRVARKSDLVLLKVDAGGHLDLHDARALLALGDRDAITSEIASISDSLPAILKMKVDAFLGS